MMSTHSLAVCLAQSVGFLHLYLLICWDVCLFENDSERKPGLCKAVQVLIKMAGRRTKDSCIQEGLQET